MVVVLDDLYGQLDLIEVDDALLRRAVELAEVHTLRGYDAIHLAGAERVAEDETILVSLSALRVELPADLSVPAFSGAHGL